MGSIYETNAILRRPPHGQGSTEPGETKAFSTAGAGSTAALDILGSDSITSYVVFRFTQDGYIRFGGSAVAAATVFDWPVKAGEVWEWLLCGKIDRYARMLRAGANDVTCNYYQSDRPPT
jgi:hypothetical protein